jgi:DUF971 family protein
MLKAPQTLRVSSDKRTLVVVWAPDNEQTLRAETLRVHSPSAEVKGHFGQGGTVPVGKEHVQMVGLEPVGSYAIKIVFSDGHSTGLYTWDYLRNLAAYA